MVLTALMLDTHIVVALFEGKTAGLSAKTLRLFDQLPTTISPAVVLELEMLFEIKRIKRRADGIVSYLQNGSSRIAVGFFTRFLKIIFQRTPVFSVSRAAQLAQRSVANP